MAQRLGMHGQLVPEQNPIAIVEKIPLFWSLEHKAMLVSGRARRRPIAKEIPLDLCLWIIRIEVMQNVLARLAFQMVEVLFQRAVGAGDGPPVSVIEIQTADQFAGLA